MKHICIYYLILFIAIAQNVFAERSHDIPKENPTDFEKELNRLSTNIRLFNNVFPQEKIWLQFDNTAYFQGDTIWYKAYVTKAYNLQRSPSQVLYVELLSPSGIVLQSIKNPIVDGQCHGNIVLKDYSTAQARELRGVLNYPSGFYEIRAYTNNMLNFDNNCIFSRVLPVYKTPTIQGDYSSSSIIISQTDKDPIRPVVDKHKKNHINIYFFPEGGDIIKGCYNRVAFKALDKNGIPINGTLHYKDNTQDICASTEHNGMGSFNFYANNNNYHCSFIASDNSEENVKLPKIKGSGYAVQLFNLSDTLVQVRIQSNSNDINYNQIGISVICRGNLIYSKIVPSNDWQNIVFNTADWPLGVCRMTVFNSDGEILASRSFFHNNQIFQAPSLEVTTPEKFIKPFEKVSLNMSLSDRFQSPIKDRVCVSIRDVNDYGNNYEDNILTNLVLTSDLRGYIHNPSYYFESNDSIHRRHLDLLMMIQGWERYEWSVMSGNSTFVKEHNIERALTLNGYIKSIFGRKELPDIKVGVQIQKKNDKTLYTYCKTNEHGYFGMNVPSFFGTKKINLKLFKMNDKYKEARIIMERSMIPQRRAYDGSELELNIPDGSITLLLDSLLIDRNDTILYSELDELLLQQQKQKFNFDNIMLNQVDITAKRYIDYDTFKAYDAEKDTENELDRGNYSTDVFGYLISKGFNPLMYSYQTIYYVHDKSKCVTRELYDNALDIDMLYVKSIIIYDEPKPLYYMMQYQPLAIAKSIQRNEQDDIQTINNIFGAINNDTLSYKNLTLVNKYGNISDDGINLYEEFNNKGMYGMGNGEKVYLVDILLKDDWENIDKKDTKLLGKRSTTVYGYSKMVDYYKTEYPEIPTDTIPQDFRRTLFWDPNVITDSLGNAQIEFYNNAYSRHFHISGSGITASGTPYCLDQDF